MPFPFASQKQKPFIAFLCYPSACFRLDWQMLVALWLLFIQKNVGADDTVFCFLPALLFLPSPSLGKKAHTHPCWQPVFPVSASSPFMQILAVGFFLSPRHLLPVNLSSLTSCFFPHPSTHWELGELCFPVAALLVRNIHPQLLSMSVRPPKQRILELASGL